MADGGLREPESGELSTDEFALRPIVAGDAESDYAAVMASRKHLRLWRQSTWPEDDFTVEDNRADLIELEQRHAAHRAFTYTVLNPSRTRCLGCVYVFPPTATFLAKSTVVPTDEDDWADVDAAVFFWVRPEQMRAAMDARLLAALQSWFKTEWRLDKTVYVTSEQFTQQANLMGRAGLTVKFEMQEPDKAGKRLTFG